MDGLTLRSKMDGRGHHINFLGLRVINGVFMNIKIYLGQLKVFKTQEMIMICQASKKKDSLLVWRHKLYSYKRRFPVIQI